MARRLKPKRVPRRKKKPTPKRPPAPIAWVPFRLYQKSVDLSKKPPIREWHPHPTIEFNIDWARPPERFGAPTKRLPAGKFLPSRSLMVYFVVQRYMRGQEGFHVVGYRVVEPALPWKALTLAGWWRFVHDLVWEYVLSYIDQRNQVEGSSWHVQRDGERAVVLWHFVKEGEYGASGGIQREGYRRGRRGRQRRPIRVYVSHRRVPRRRVTKSR